MGQIPAAIPPNEEARLEALRALHILDTPPEVEFDAIVRLAAQICGVPVALVSLVDEQRQWFKARVGLEAEQTRRDVSYCAHAILHDEIMVVPDAAKDPRFADNPLRVGEPHVEFYAGVPLRTSSGQAVGTLCVIDHAPRTLTSAQKAGLEALAQQVVRLLELRRLAISQHKASATRRRPSGELPRLGSSFSLAPVVEQHRVFSKVAFAVALVLGLCSLLATFWVSRSIEATHDARLAHAAARAEHFLEERAHAYAAMLRGAAALFTASEHVSRSEYRAYVEALRLAHNYPGVLGVGYIEAVERAELEAYLARARADFPDYRVTEQGTGPELALVRYIEPLGANRVALGYNLLSDPERQRSLLVSKQTRDVVLSGRVRLLQDPKASGFLFMLPIRRPTDPLAEVRGWVTVVVRARDFMKGIEQAAGGEFALRVLDERGRPPPNGERARGVDGPAVVHARVADADFVIEVRPTSDFASITERGAPWAVLLLGLSATVLSFALINAMRRIEARSRTLADNMTKAIRQGERELRAVIDGTADFVLAFGAEGYLVLTNRAFREVLGFDKLRVYEMSIHDVVHPSVRDAFEQALAPAADGGSSRYVETTFVSASGSSIEVEGALSFVAEEGITRAIFRDVSARKQAERALLAANTALEQLASTDGLTGVANRRTFDARLAEELSRARRHGTQLSLLMLDVDHFKWFNDCYGHQKGDECLRRVAGCMAVAARRAGELAARYGGEEFAVILSGSDYQAAMELAERLRCEIEALGLAHERHPLGKVTASIGVASFDARTMRTAEELIAAADGALYRAKSGGRNRVELAG